MSKINFPFSFQTYSFHNRPNLNIQPLHLSGFTGLKPLDLTPYFQFTSKSTGSPSNYIQYLVSTAVILHHLSTQLLQQRRGPLHPTCSTMVYIPQSIQKDHFSGQNPPLPSPLTENKITRSSHGLLMRVYMTCFSSLLSIFLLILTTYQQIVNPLSCGQRN